MNKLHYWMDHDFRNSTKLVWHFYDFSMIYYKFYKFTLQAKLESALQFKKAGGNKTGPAVAITAWAA